MCCKSLSPRLILLLAALGLALGVGQFASTYANDGKPDQGNASADNNTKVPGVLNFKVKSIDDKDVHLTRYYGDVVLIVNTASKCGNTPQYKPLQQLHETYAEEGLSILGFPANNFRSQEPGTDEDISAFCTKNYGVKFDMFSKISVKGEDQAPLYQYLTSKETNPKFGGEIQWNFDKFLVGRDGTIIARFAHKTQPDSQEVTDAIKAALKQPVPADVKAVRASHAEEDKQQDKAE